MPTVVVAAGGRGRSRSVASVMTPRVPSEPTNRHVLLVALFSQGLQVVLVTVLLGGFYVAFGLLTISG